MPVCYLRITYIRNPINLLAECKNYIKSNFRFNIMPKLFPVKLCLLLNLRKFAIIILSSIKLSQQCSTQYFLESTVVVCYHIQHKTLAGEQFGQIWQQICQSFIHHVLFYLDFFCKATLLVPLLNINNIFDDLECPFMLPATICY